MSDHTHAPGLRSWVESANDGATDFPIQNLPFGVARPTTGDAGAAFRIVVAIGDQALDLARAVDLLPETVGAVRDAARASTLNALMARPPHEVSALRGSISRLLRADTDEGKAARTRAAQLLFPLAAAEYALPAAVGDYTDFYASIHHATNVGKMFRPDQPLMPNYKWVPIGYHGRASSLVVSGTPVVRPFGQATPAGDGAPPVGPTSRLDYEVEIGFFIGQGNVLGAPIAIGNAGAHLFGVCLLNDWSARDIQAWEYQPLGPFLSKSFVTTLSPWVVTREALSPFRVAAAARAPGDPAPLPYLRDAADAANGGIAVTVEVELTTARMRAEHAAPARLSRSQLQEMYWTPAQLVAHHTSNGCNLRPGDLLGSGTISGSGPTERGCLLELTARGTEPLTLPNGETRRFLEDGDEVTLRGWCEKGDAVRIGLGECRGRVMAAPVGSVPR